MGSAFEQEFPLPKLITKTEVDDAILSNEDKVVVLCFGRESDLQCMIFHNIVLSHVISPSYSSGCSLRNARFR